MAIQQYELTEENCKFGRLHGFSVEVQTTASPGFEIDQDRLIQWCVHIASGYVEGDFSRNSLLDDAVHIRLTSGTGAVILDTIADCVRHE